VTVVHAESGTVAFGALDGAGPLMIWLVVLSFVFVECAFIVGLFLPGDSLLFTAGVLLAQGDHEWHGWALSVVATVIAVVGNQLGYYVGRRTGTSLLARRGGKVLTEEKIQRARDFLNRRGFWAIVLARWLPWVRTLAPLVAGAARMDPRKYLVATSFGAVLWVPTLVLTGYYGADLLSDVPWLGTAFVVGGVAFLVLGTGYGIWQYRREMRRPVESQTVPIMMDGSLEAAQIGAVVASGEARGWAARRTRES
jgi:membrane-associated protein